MSAHTVSTTASAVVISMRRICGSSTCCFTDGSSITPLADHHPVYAATPAEMAPSTSSHNAADAIALRPASHPMRYSSAAPYKNAIGKCTNSGCGFCRCAAPGRNLASTLFYGFHLQVVDTVLGVHLAGNRDLIFHMVDDVLGQRLIVFGRDKNVVLVGALFDHHHRNAGLGA